MQTITVHKHIPDEQADGLAGRLLTDDDYDIVVRDNCVVLKEDGTPLLIYCKGVIPTAACKTAYPALRQAAMEYSGASNRGTATGKFRIVGATANFGIVSPDGNRIRPLKYDGTVSNTSYALSEASVINRIKLAGGRVEQQLSNGDWIEIDPEVKQSGVVGYLDKNQRFPYCRLTAFNINHPEKFQSALPLIHAVDHVFKARLPDRYAAQTDVVQNTVDDYVITGTAFTTITVNLNFQTAVHKDAGDLKAGFGVMSALRAGKFDGCYTCFPQYRVAADMQTGDVLLADVHEWHGNTPLKPKGPHERLSLVFYYRENMKNCGTPTEELEHAKQKRGRL